MKNKDIIIIGAGASGLMAAISAARQGASVLCLEHMEKPGKKILMTGNGKCNFTNDNQDLSNYYGASPAFLKTVFSKFSKEDTISFFKGIGVPPMRKNGYVYPFNEEASGVQLRLYETAQALGVEFLFSIGIRSIEKQENGYSIHTKSGDFFGKACILCTGGASFPKSGSDGSGLLYLGSFKQPTKDIVPSLVQLKAKESFFKNLAGIRAQSLAKIYVNGQFCSENFGEVQFADYGLSGIPIFQISRFASYGLKEEKQVEVRLNFFPEITEAELSAYLETLLASQDGSVQTALSGLLHQKMIPVLCKLAGFSPEKAAKKIRPEQVQRFAALCQNFSATITGTTGFQKAQVTAGGIDTAFVHPETLESTLHKGLFFAGEVLDVDGLCGGYNLQWAWSSGHVAGTAAAKLVSAS